MEVQTTEQRQAGQKRRIRLVAGLFFGLLVAFTLLGNTLQALTLPRAVTTQPGKGALEHAYRGSATLRPGEERDLTNPAGWKVANVLVKQGDAVQAGQTLVEYDDSEAKLQLEDMQAALQKLNMSMDQLERNFIEAAQQENEPAKASAKTAIEAAHIDIASQERHIQLFQQQLEANRQLVAPFDGIVAEVHAAVGLPSSGMPDIRLSNSAKGFRFELQIPANVAATLNVGDTLDVQLLGKSSRMMRGDIAGLEDTVVTSGGGSGNAGDNPSSPATNRLIVAVSDPSLLGGERVQVNIAKASKENQLLVPNDSVRKDSSGTYVYTVKEQKGPLGNAYYAVRTPVEIIDANESMTAVSGGLFEQQSIIAGGSEAITDGTRIRLQ